MPPFLLFDPFDGFHVFFGDRLNEVTQFHQARLYFHEFLNCIQAANLSISDADFVYLVNLFTK